MATVFAEKTAYAQAESLQTRRAGVIGFFALLFIIDCYLYFWNPGHFFQADSLDRALEFGHFSRLRKKLPSLAKEGWPRHQELLPFL